MTDLSKNPSAEPSKRPIPEAVTVQKAAEVLSVCTLTIHRWINSGYLKAYRVGPRLVRIPRSELARLRSVRIEFTVNEERPTYPKV